MVFLEHTSYLPCYHTDAIQAPPPKKNEKITILKSNKPTINTICTENANLSA